MYLLDPAIRNYQWGSTEGIQRTLRLAVDGQVMAEAWFGAHPDDPSAATVANNDIRPLNEVIALDPGTALGEDVVARFGAVLPYLLKLIAVEGPLSLQVHPNIDQAVEGYSEEERANVPKGAPHRNYRDRNHKPELVYALTDFEGLSGFRAPRRVIELLRDLHVPLAAKLADTILATPGPEGIRAAFTQLLEPETRPSQEEIEQIKEACAARLERGSPSPRADRILVRLVEAYPGDPGAVTSLLLNPVTLHPGEAMFVPAGSVHAYLKGVAIEVMANSDNVLRAGLTTKHVDVAELLATVDCVAAPPIRIGPEEFRGRTHMYYAPVEDFQLSVTELLSGETEPLPSAGPRTLLLLSGEVRLSSAASKDVVLQAGQAAFIPAEDGLVVASGRGVIIQASVP